MDEISPAVVTIGSDIVQCDGIEITTNLFKNHKMSTNLVNNKNERLNTYLRIRALNQNETQSKTTQSCFKVLDSKCLLVIPPKGSNTHKNGSELEERKFSFTQIFDERVDQLSVYENCALDIVKRFLCGENGLLFAYGITSSGKSYTMRGTTSSPGVIPRALNTIFDVIGHRIVKEMPNLKPNRFCEFISLSKNDKEFEDNLRKFIFDTIDKKEKLSLNSFHSQISSINETTNHENHWNDVLHSTFRSDVSDVKCCVWISFYEIYNETIYDLLDLEISGEKKQNIILLKDENQNYYIKGLRQICVGSAEEAYKVLLFGQNNLHISSTDLNKRSSRSHCAFNISIIRTNTTSKRPIITVNNLSFCDLAGAERSDKANNSGDRIREAGKINGSLLSLSRCLAAIRHNQKYEYDKNRQHFVNFRDSKLTKVFQPFLCGNGITSMISNMNPSPHLFDETLFALKFTGVASQIVVSTEEQRNKLQESLKRLTQVWMQSSQRWSNFAHLNPHKPSVSIIQTHQTIEEEDDESDNLCLDMTVEELEKKVNEISRMDLSRADPQEMEILKTQVDFLIEKLNQCENEKFEMEFHVRKQVVSEFQKLINDMEEMAETKDKAKKKLEEMMSERLKNAEIIHKEERMKYEERIKELEIELFKDKEDLCKEFEQNKELSEKFEILSNESKSEINALKQILIEKESEINSLKALIAEQNQMIVPLDDKKIEFCDRETSVSNLLVTDSKQTSFHVECVDKGINTSFILQSPQREDKSSSIHIECADKGVDTSTLFNSSKEDKSLPFHIDCDDKGVNTSLISNSHMKEDKSVSTNLIVMNNISTSPLVVNSTENLLENYILKQEFESMKNSLEKQLKEKEAMIAFNREIVEQRDEELRKLKEEKEKLLSNTHKEINFENLFKSSKSLKPVLSIASISSTHSLKSEDTISITSAASLALKEKQNQKTAKYSSRKKNINLDNSSNKRYLFSVCENEDIERNCKTLSQSSVDSDLIETTQDEIGSLAYSTAKKRAERKANKRKQVHNSSNNEGYSNKAPESKRKRPTMKTLSISPISPIPSEETVKRMTRSRARKAIKF